jgi:7-carboxy-7-deazaguanine synthase (Cx14CxxC type)
MAYMVKEIYYTVQGEGTQTGRPAVFCRFAGCNLWSGREQERENAICQFCDTDFFGVDGPGGGKFETANSLTSAIIKEWDNNQFTVAKPFVVCTGGEPLLQIDKTLIDEIHTAGFEIAIETNGTIIPPKGLDWICVSPKSGAELLLKNGDELKLVYPQHGVEPEQYQDLDFNYFFLQPMDGPRINFNTELSMYYCLKNPRWKVSLQTHKILNLP